MSKQFYPYVIFLPPKRKQEVLRAIFRSRVSIDVFKFSISQGISEKIYQKDLIKSLGYSNKTIIEKLKTLTDLRIFEEDMEKVETGGRTVWVKYFVLSDLGRWFALLLAEEDALSKDKKAEIVSRIFRSYVVWAKNLLEKLDFEKEILEEIFLKEMEKPSLLS